MTKQQENIEYEIAEKYGYTVKVKNVCKLTHLCITYGKYNPETEKIISYDNTIENLDNKLIDQYIKNAYNFTGLESLTKEQICFIYEMNLHEILNHKNNIKNIKQYDIIESYCLANEIKKIIDQLEKYQNELAAYAYLKFRFDHLL